MDEYEREHQRQISDALLTLRHARISAYELRPGDQIIMRRHDLDESTLCQNDSGYRTVEVLDVRTVYRNGHDREVEVTITEYAIPQGAEKFCCSPLFNAMFKIGKDERA